MTLMFFACLAHCIVGFGGSTPEKSPLSMANSVAICIGRQTKPEATNERTKPVQKAKGEEEADSPNIVLYYYPFKIDPYTAMFYERLHTSLYKKVIDDKAKKARLLALLKPMQRVPGKQVKNQGKAIHSTVAAQPAHYNKERIRLIVEFSSARSLRVDKNGIVQDGPTEYRVDIVKLHDFLSNYYPFYKSDH